METKITDVKEKVKELMEGKVNVNQTPTMIEEARALREDLTKLRDEIKSEREKLDHIHAQAMLGGRGLLVKNVEKTKEEIAKEEAKEILKVYGK